MASIQLEHVSKTFPSGVKAVSDLQLSVNEGELLVLVGPSGCGKTTTLRMIAGLESVSSGIIRIGEREVTKMGPAARNVAMMFQSDALYPHLSVRDNLAFGFTIKNKPWWQHVLSGILPVGRNSPIQGDIEQRIIQTASWLGLSNLLERKPHELSGGERRRVALGQAMISQPGVLMLDEPLANLDSRLQVAMRAEVKRLQQQFGQTMLIVTHDQALAMSLGDRIAMMDAGELLQIGPPLDVYHRPCNRRVAILLGSPTLNLLRGKVVRTGGQWWFMEKSWQAELAVTNMPDGAFPPVVRDGRAVELGVRPEDVCVSLVTTGVAATDSTVHSLAKIVMVEALGDSAILHLQRESDSRASSLLRVKSDDSQGFCVGQTVRLRFARCHWFDTETGLRLVE